MLRHERYMHHEQVDPLAHADHDVALLCLLQVKHPLGGCHIVANNHDASEDMWFCIAVRE